MPTDAVIHWDRDRLIAETFVADVELHDELASTNDHAMSQAISGEVDLPRLIVTDRQTQGRGRGSNRWWSSAGALTFSLLLEPGNQQLPASRWPQMSLTAGSSICAAVAKLVPGEDVRLKWPNDVYLRGAKLCGVLVEVPPATVGRVVIGVGLNVNNSVMTAPPELSGRAIALCDVGPRLSRQDVLIGILHSFAEQIAELSSNPDGVRQRWRRFDLLTGRCVTIDDGFTTTTGTCVGIDDDGALLLRTEAGTKRCYAGVVQSYE